MIPVSFFVQTAVRRDGNTLRLLQRGSFNEDDSYRDVIISASTTDGADNVLGGGVTATCEICSIINHVQFQIPRNSSICKRSHCITFPCGCNNGELFYLDTSCVRLVEILSHLLCHSSPTQFSVIQLKVTDEVLSY